MNTSVKPLFKRKANRFCVFFAEYGPVPVASELDDIPMIVVGLPQRIGDTCVIHVEGQFRLAILLNSVGMARDRAYLVDLGPAKEWL